MQQKPCVFCQIIGKQIPAKIVYEDGSIIAFLDINPLSPGHTLIVPKKHVENIFDIDEKDLQHIFTIAKKISLKIKGRLQADGVNFLQASGKGAEQIIPHFHLHVVPRKEGDGINLNEWWKTKAKKLEDSKLDEIAKLLKIEESEEIKEESEEKKEEKPKERSKEESYWIRRDLELG
jgi:histidine triad (HIT) family protein